MGKLGKGFKCKSGIVWTRHALERYQKRVKKIKYRYIVRAIPGRLREEIMHYRKGCFEIAENVFIIVKNGVVLTVLDRYKGLKGI